MTPEMVTAGAPEKFRARGLTPRRLAAPHRGVGLLTSVMSRAKAKLELVKLTGLAMLTAAPACRLPLLRTTGPVPSDVSLLTCREGVKMPELTTVVPPE